jgi:hypothetical protein
MSEPTPVPTPSSEQQLEEARSHEHKTTAEEAVIKLDSTSAIFVTQAERGHHWPTRSDGDQEGMTPSGVL